MTPHAHISKADVKVPCCSAGSWMPLQNARL